MSKKQLAEDLLYQSVELQALGQTKLNVAVEAEAQSEYIPEREIICPKCGSQDCWKRGNRSRGRKEYSCKTCKKFFLIYPLIDDNSREIKCPDCESRNYSFNGQYKDKNKYRCRDCNRGYVLNSHGRDELDSLNNMKCKWCNSSNFRLNGFSNKGQRKIRCVDCQKQSTIGTNFFAPLVASQEFDFNHDIWIADHLGYGRGIHKHYKLNFSYISQTWLKKITKKYFLYLVSIGIAFSTLIGKVSHLNIFSQYLQSISYLSEFNDLTRNLIIDFLAYLKIKNYSHSTHSHILETLSKLFETGTLNNWFQVPPALIRPEDRLKHPKVLPRFIPEEVMQQLNQHLGSLPGPVMRMVLMDIECGFRVGELLRLKLDCLKSDGKGGWYVQYYMYKMNKEHTKPISDELARVIQEQQVYIKQTFGDEFPYLFCGRARTESKRFIPEPKLMTSTSFISHLKRLTKQFNIKDNSGQLWNFQTHQFRHTVGTRMINAGVPQHIIQRYLGHESPTMTQRYAHIHDETLRKEIEKYHDSRVVNFQGETVELEETILSSNDDLEWFKKNVQARALEHGYCARPKLLGNCDIPGFDGCYNCPHWRTNQNFLPILKDTLERTEKVIEKARNCGWELQVSKNEPIKHNLEKVIKSLEEQGNEQKD
jgi:integrase/transposase-like protein